MGKSYRNTPEGKFSKKYPEGYKRKRRHDDQRILRSLTRHGDSNIIDLDETDLSFIEEEQDFTIYKKSEE